MNYLLLDTSSGQGFASWAQNDQVVASFFTQGNNSHLEEVPIFVEQLLQKHGSPDAVAVVAGPGSYTGLRIGLSLAKGICFGSGAKLILLDTLAVMREAYLLEFGQETTDNALLIPMLDARRMEVFHAVYRKDATLVTAPIPLILTEEWLQALPLDTVLIGEGSSKIKQLNSSSYPKLFEAITTTPQALFNLAEAASQKEIYTPLAQAVPLYTKAFYTNGLVFPEADANGVLHGSGENKANQ